MNHIDPPGINLSMAVIALMNNSSGTIEETAREVLVAIACFLENQGKQSDCGGLNSLEGIGKAASEEYDELVKFRKHFDDLDKKRPKSQGSIASDLVKKMFRREISKEEMYKQAGVTFDHNDE